MGMSDASEGRKPSEGEDLDVDVGSEMGKGGGHGPVDARGGQQVLVKREHRGRLEGVWPVMDLPLIELAPPHGVEEITLRQKVLERAGPGWLSGPDGLSTDQIGRWEWARPAPDAGIESGRCAGGRVDAFASRNIRDL